MFYRLLPLLRFILGTLLLGGLAWMTQVSPEEVIPRLSKWWVLIFGSSPAWMTESRVRVFVVILTAFLALGLVAWIGKLVLAKSKKRTAAEILYPKPTLLTKTKDWLANTFPTVYRKRRAPAPPEMALNDFADPQMLARMRKMSHEIWQIEAQIAIIDHQLSRFHRRQFGGGGEASFAAARGPSDEEVELNERRDELIEKRTWAEVHNEATRNDVLHDFYGKLFAGKLIAHGFVMPHTPGNPSVDIPQLEWDFLRFDDSWGEAVGQGIRYRVINIRSA
jgi:hypothetical protein